MIIKSFEIKKIDQNINNLILFYGKNEGLKNEALDVLFEDKNNISNYDEKEILDNENNFIENILSKSLFEKQKFIVIKRATDKIFKVIEILNSKNLEDVTIVLNSDNLEKKSKLRSFFEKDKKLVCVPFYPDNDQTLSKLAYSFSRDNKISISPSNINLIVNKCSGDREKLANELQKIEYFTKNGKKIDSENISKLINLSENHSISELIDNCLAKNKKKIVNILNENNFSNEDCIMITRSFLIKAKKLLTLSTLFESNKNIDLTISSAKPPIFWKEKEITKQQIYKWKPKNIKKLIFTLSETELQIKKNINNSINLITDFILSQSSSETNSKI
ncbi:DNA polymerase III subunit delta [Candidatus Pelagibacter sp.]|nr:DNA polymerase III subunit delta [Candidatus Pelagibacter sp.]